MNGLNVDPKYAIGQMEHVRSIFDKTDGVQAHLFIQSFAPGEVTPQKANDLGLELAKAISHGKQYQVAIYTHNDTDHIHNHLILNAVDFETGLKYQQSFDVKRVRELSDSICKENGLSVIQEEQQKDKKPIAEIKAEENGDYIWKTDLRERIISALTERSSFDPKGFRKNLALEGVDVRYRGKGLSYSFIDFDGKKRISRGSKLGTPYDKKAVISQFRQNEQYNKEHDISPKAKQMIQTLTSKWHEWENRINEGIQLESAIRKELYELTPKLDNINKQITQLEQKPAYVKFNQLNKKREDELNHVEKRKQAFESTKNRQIFKKTETWLDLRHQENNLQKSTTLQELKQLKPEKEQISLKINQLVEQSIPLIKRKKSLQDTLQTNNNIRYRDYYRGHQRDIIRDIERWKIPEHEASVDRKAERIRQQRQEISQGLSL